jgi:dihydroxyacetone kinase phosphotransfer subunit
MVMGERSVWRWRWSPSAAAPHREEGRSVIGLVLVGHSEDVVRGVAAMVGQAAPAVPIAVAGGLSGGRLGTDGLAVAEALRGVLAATDDPVLVLLDLGSAAMALEVALDQLPPADRSRVRATEAPFVEGAVAAAVEAASGGGIDRVASAAERSLRLPKLARD